MLTIILTPLLGGLVYQAICIKCMPMYMSCACVIDHHQKPTIDYTCPSFIICGSIYMYMKTENHHFWFFSITDLYLAVSITTLFFFPISQIEQKDERYGQTI